MEARSQIRDMLGPWVLATDPHQIWDQGLKKSARQAFHTILAKKRNKFQYFGFFGAQTAHYDTIEKGIGISDEKLTGAPRDIPRMRLEKEDRLKKSQ